MVRKIFHFFDRLEDKVRARLSHMPLVYALIGGVGVVLFWRGVWHLADEINMSSIISVLTGSVILLISGAFVSTFIGAKLIITGLKGEKKLVEKTEDEIKLEGSELKHLENELDDIKKELSEIKSEIKSN